MMWKSSPTTSRSLAGPGDQFPWYAQACTNWCDRSMIYALPFGAGPGEYKTTLCIVCQKRRRGRPRPHWYVQTAADLPGAGEDLNDWEARKRADPGVFS